MSSDGGKPWAENELIDIRQGRSVGHSQMDLIVVSVC